MSGGRTAALCTYRARPESAYGVAKRVALETLTATAGTQALAGLAAAVLGTLALVGIAPATVILVAMLALGASIPLTGDAAVGRMSRMSQPDAPFGSTGARAEQKTAKPDHDLRPSKFAGGRPGRPAGEFEIAIRLLVPR